MRIAGQVHAADTSPWVIVAGGLGAFLGLCLSVYVPLDKRPCFLDLACVHQGDRELQSRGIVNIGGCLSMSKELRVLYDPAYFQSCLAERASALQAGP